jgi:hypothetical protein
LDDKEHGITLINAWVAGIAETHQYSGIFRDLAVMNFFAAAPKRIWVFFSSE